MSRGRSTTRVLACVLFAAGLVACGNGAGNRTDDGAGGGDAGSTASSPRAGRAVEVSGAGASDRTAAAAGETANAGERSDPITGIRYLGGGDSAGFERAMTPRVFVFPRDHGNHPHFRTEWWYFTGNVFGAEGRHYGFEVTFFRVGLRAPPTGAASPWTTDQIWMAHFALTDTANREFHAAERLSRGALGLAGVELDPLHIWVEDWSARVADDGTLRVRAADGPVAVDLALAGIDRIVAQGDRGLDAKGPEPGNASYYYSAPRLDARGTIRVGDAPADSVAGNAWMDREWSTSALSAGIEGWDWFGLELDDGRDLMFYRLRGSDGATSPFSGGSIAAPDGSVRRLAADEVELEVEDRWRSPTTRVRYPVAWRMRIPTLGLELSIEPRLRNQELDLSVRYWEGAVRVSGRSGADEITGNGYLELAGY